MSHEKITLIAGVALMLLGVSGCVAPSPAESIAVVPEGSAFSLSVPVSRVGLKIPKEGLSLVPREVDATNPSNRYFHFEDFNTGFIATGWFEPAERYKGMQKNWASNVDSWPKLGIPAPEQVLFEKQGDWDVVQFQQVGVKEQAGKRFQACYAEYISAGTWIELHLSKPYSPTAARELAAFIQSVQIIVKP